MDLGKIKKRPPVTTEDLFVLQFYLIIMQVQRHPSPLVQIRKGDDDVPY